MRFSPQLHREGTKYKDCWNVPGAPKLKLAAHVPGAFGMNLKGLLVVLVFTPLGFQDLLLKLILGWKQCAKVKD